MDFPAFAQAHVPEITATTGLITYSLLKDKLTPAGILAGILVAGIHMLHPWPGFFWLLIFFFFFGTVVTKIGHSAKALLTTSASGGSGGEGPRSHIQVFANSGFACILIAIHAWLLSSSPFISSSGGMFAGPHFPTLQRLLPVGIVAQYAAVAADTFSSELGILSKGQPFMITAPWKKVPKGTNGGVTIDGLLYGALGSFLLTSVASIALYFGHPRTTMDVRAFALLTIAGLAGSVIDSLLGALLQVTVTDKGTGKVVEGAGGSRVKVLPEGSRAQTGMDLLTNNGVNFVMAALASLGAMSVAYGFGVALI